MCNVILLILFDVIYVLLILCNVILLILSLIKILGWCYEEEC